MAYRQTRPALDSRALARLERERWDRKRADAAGLEQRLALGLVDEGGAWR